ncbi:ATP-dependent helicase C-terminal domain-containing protein, partial [Beijerinckia sp. L45]|uniref:ATP-dependent helicase C-terminal domain-containing protein n=1 Tax=Beijerinckia sp. L45 TaxID=1641855 RepID=UPI00273808B5
VALEAVAGDAITEKVELSFDPGRAALRARRIRRLGALVLAEGNLGVPPGEDAARCLAAGIAALGIERLPWTPAIGQWRDRVQFLRQAQGEAWPDLSDAALAADDAAWLLPVLDGVTSVAGIGADKLDAALKALLPWDVARKLEAEAPTHVTTPAGASHRLDYAAEAGPTLAVKVQELFGLSVHPSVAGGRVPLVLELLSPAGRPIQITRDLPGFWRGSWADVRADLRGRYPRHPWPDDPAAALPTLRAKPRGT